MAKLLVVDDEPAILQAFRRAFREGDIVVLTAESAIAGLETAQQQHPDVIILDIQLPDMNGLEMLNRLRELDARSPIIFISGKGTTDTAIEAMKRGAYDYLLKPLELSELRQVIERAVAISRLMHVPAIVAADATVDDRADAIVGRCPAMQEVYKSIGRVAAQDVVVLIGGESGTGKELVARAIYGHSCRAAGPFMTINCAAIPETLLESELFGHERGAFTGADQRRIGKFEQCSGGTLFLDEVGDMSPLTQSKMLRLLQEQTFERLGGNETVRTDVRILAATNHDLEKLVAQGRFRPDLYYRLSVFTIRLPPLRERGDDLFLLVQHYLRRYNRELSRHVEEVAPEAMSLLRRYSWPGNVRELQSALKQALLYASGPILIPDFLPPFLISGETDLPHGEAPGVLHLEQFVEDQLHAGSENLYEAAVQRLERFLLPRVLQHTGGNQVQAARILGINRGSLRLKVRDLGITLGRTVTEGEREE